MNAIFGDTIDKIFFRESLKILFFVSFLIFSLDLFLNFVKELEDLNSNYSFLEILQNEEGLISKVDQKVLFITTDSWLAQLGSRKNS